MRGIVHLHQIRINKPEAIVHVVRIHHVVVEVVYVIIHVDVIMYIVIYIVYIVGVVIGVVNIVADVIHSVVYVVVDVVVDHIVIDVVVMSEAYSTEIVAESLSKVHAVVELGDRIRRGREMYDVGGRP